MSEPSTVCPRCAGPMPGGSLSGHCPRCLAGTVLNAGGDEDSGNNRLIGDCELLETIGEGGMGRVYRARRADGGIVAVKVMRAGLFAGAAMRKRFHREALTAASLKHPGIVAVHEAGEWEDQPFLVMDCVEGTTLEAAASAGPVPARRAAGWLLAIARAVQYSHESGVLHRDLKPSNVLLDRDDQPRLTDFGLAKSVDGSPASFVTRSGETLGSPHYMPPEQAQPGKAVDCRADVYALGAILYHLLTGRPPFQGESPHQIIAQVVSADPVAPRRLVPQTPRDLETICLRCLRKNPARRYQSALALAEDLQRFLSGEKINARPLGAAGRAGRWCRRHPGIAVMLAFLMAGTLTAFLIIDAARRSEGRARQSAEQLSGQLKTANTELGRTNMQLIAQTDAAEIWRAEDAFAAGDSTEALALLTGVLRRSPDHPVAGARMASAYWQGGIAVPEPRLFPAGARVEKLLVSPAGGDALVCTSEGPEWWDPGFRRKIKALPRAPSRLNSFARSANGRVLAGWRNARGGGMALWEMPEGRLLPAPASDPYQWPLWVALSSDGARCLAAMTNGNGGDGSPQLRDTRSGEPVGPVLPHPDGLWSAAFSPDGRWLVTSEATHLHVWDAATLEKRRSLPDTAESVMALHFSAEGQWLAAGCLDGAVLQFDVRDDFRCVSQRRHEAAVISVSFSPDSRRLLTTARDGTARLWQVPDGTESAVPLRHTDSILFAGFSPDGTRVVTGSQDATVRVWSAESGRPLTQPLRQMERPLCAAFTADGNTLCVGGLEHILVHWRLPVPARTLISIPHPARIRDAAWSPDGRRIVTGSQDGTAQVWEATDGKETASRASNDAEVRAVCFSPDGAAFALGTGSGRIVIAAAERNAVLATPTPHGKAITGLAFSPDGKWLASGSEDGTARVWDIPAGKPLTGPLACGDKLVEVRFAPNGKRLLTVSTAAGATLWDLPGGRQTGDVMHHGLPPLIPGTISHAAFSPDGCLIATAGGDNVARLWEVETGRPFPLKPVRHRRTVEQVAFSPDGALLATVSADATARLWKTADLEPMTPALTHGHTVKSAGFLPNGSHLVTASYDGTVRLWHVPDGLPAAEPWHHPAGVSLVAVSPEGTRLLSVCGDNNLRIWEIPAFTGRPPDWLMELTSALTLAGAPQDPAEGAAFLQRYQKAVAAALATPADTVWGRLARRLFEPSTPGG